MQQIYNFENNIKKFYTTLEQSKKIEKISIPSFDDLWDDKLLTDTIKLCQEYIKENITIADGSSWAKLVAELGAESERRYNLNIFFAKAQQNNALMNLNKMPDDIVNLIVWMTEHAKNVPNELIKIKLTVAEDKIDVFTNLGAFCHQNWDLNQLYNNLSTSENPKEIFNII